MSQVQLINQVLQAIFFVVAGAVTLLTYLKARDTILQPMRLEVFKEQIKLMGDLLSVFHGKTELDLRREYGIDKTAAGNIARLKTDYGELFFDSDFPQNNPRATKDFPMSRLKLSAFDEGRAALANEPVRPDQPMTAPTSQMDPAVKAAKWTNGHYDEELLLADSFVQLDQRLEALASSPLMPSAIATLIDKYRDLAETNLNAISASIPNIAQRFPEYYDSADKLRRAEFGWAKNMINGKLVPMQPLAATIIKIVRDHFGTNRIPRLG